MIEEDLKEVLAEDENLLEKKGERENIRRIRRKDTGELRYVKIYSKVDYTESGTLRMYGIMQDITEYQRKQNELKLFKKAIEASNSGITITDYQKDENPIIYCNQTFLDLTGYNYEEVKGRNCRFLQGTDRDQQAIEKMRTDIEQGRNSSVILRNYRKDGTVFWNRVGLAPIRDNKDRVTHYIGIQQDITQQVELRQSLAESERKWEKLVQLNPDIILIHIDEQIEFANKSGAQLAGVESPEDLKGRSIYEVFDQPDKTNQVNERLQLLNNDTGTNFVTYTVNTGNGSQKYIRTRSNSFVYDGKDAKLTVGQEITEQYEYQLKLQRLLEENRVLIEEIHHRVKNNMAIVSGLLELQKDQINNSTAQRALLDSQLRIQSMANVHEHLYRSDELTSINTTSYVKELIQKIQQSLDVSGIEFKTDVDECILNVNKAMPLGLLLNELTTNAIQHAFQENSENNLIGIYIKKIGENKIEVEVRDNGKGLPENFNFESTDTLGFSIMKKLIHQLDATYEVRSDASGTSVSVRFDSDDEKGSQSNL